MKKVVNDIRLMIKVCDMYYNQNVSQQQIASGLNISRPTVSRLLSSAREQEIVKISVANMDMVKYWELEKKIIDLYQLQDVVIVDSQPDEETLQYELGRLAGKYLEYHIKDNYVVGVSMGSTLYQTVSQMSGVQASNVTFVPLIGGMGNIQMEMNANSLAEAFSRVYQGRFVPLHAPARVSNSMIRDNLMKEESMEEVLRMEECLDVAVVGIGGLNPTSAPMVTGYFKEEDISFLREHHVAGEICLQFYDCSGDTFPYRNQNNIIGLELRKYRKIPCSIGIAGGKEKIPAILGAIRGQYINVLITDAQCAHALIEESYCDHTDQKM